MAWYNFWQTPEQASIVTTKAVKEDEGDGIFKAYIPDFLYKPPYGMPRKVNTPYLKQLSKNPYIFSVIKTMCDEAVSIGWKVQVKEEFAEDGNDYSDKIKEVTDFLKKPNGNYQSFEHILRQVITDILEVDSGVIVKVFNREQKMVQIFGRDGSLFLKNPDIYGYMGDKDDFVMPMPDAFLTGGSGVNAQQRNHYELAFKDQSAYFQYGWTAGSMPVPFGRREIIYIMQNPRGDSIYGRSPVEILESVVKNLIYGVDYNLDFFTNNSMPDGVISLLGANKPQITNFKDNLHKKFKFTDILGTVRKKFFTYPVTSAEVKFTPFQLNPKDMDVISQQTWFTKIMWMCFGVTADEMGFTETSNKTSGEEQTKAHARKALKPLLNLLSYHLTAQLVTEFFEEGEDVALEFAFDDYDIDEEIKKRALLKSEMDMGVKTVEMVAKELNIDVDELKKQQDSVEEKERDRFSFEAETNGKQQDDGFPPKKEKVVEKALPVKKTLLDELDDYIDGVGDQVEKMVENEGRV